MANVLVLNPLQRKLLNAVIVSGTISRAELGRRLSWSRSRLSPEISRLVERGVLRQAGFSRSTGGRRGALLEAGGPEVGVVAGIDIDAERVGVVVTALGGNPLARTEEALPAAEQPVATLHRVSDLLASTLPPGCGPLTAIGVSVAADVDPHSATLATSPTMPKWTGQRVADHFAKRFGVRSFVDNDVNVLALAESTNPKGIAEQGSTFLVVKLSSGVGCGIVINGTLFRGSDGFAGDIGHICADPSDPTPCACGNKGCLEALVGSDAIARSAAELLGDAWQPAPDRAAHRNPLAVVGEAAAAGNPAASELLRLTGRRVGLVVAGVVSFFNPVSVLVSAGIGEAGGTFLSSMRQAVYERALPVSTQRLQILEAPQGPEAGADGAASLATAGFLGSAGSVGEARPAPAAAGPA